MQVRSPFSSYIARANQIGCRRHHVTADFHPKMGIRFLIRSLSLPPVSFFNHPLTSALLFPPWIPIQPFCRFRLMQTCLVDSIPVSTRSVVAPRRAHHSLINPATLPELIPINSGPSSRHSIFLPPVIFVNVLVSTLSVPRRLGR